MDGEPVVSFELILPTSELEVQHTALQSGGAETADPVEYKPTPEELDEYSHAAFEPMLLLAGAVALGFLVERIVDAVKNARHGGLIIDRTGESIRIIESSALRRGTMLVLGPKGEREFDLSTPPIDIVGAIKGIVPGKKRA